MSQSFARIVFTLTVVFFATFFLWPILQILKAGFIDTDGHFTLRYFSTLLADPLYRGGLANSFMLACATTTLAFSLAMPLAFSSNRYVLPGKNLLSALILVPIDSCLRVFVGAIASSKSSDNTAQSPPSSSHSDSTPMAGPLTGSPQISLGHRSHSGPFALPRSSISTPPPRSPT